MSLQNNITSDNEDESEIECSTFKYEDHELKPVKTMQDFHSRFNLGRVLGGGGDGDVFEDKKKGWCAIKKIKLFEFQDAAFELKRAQQEQRLLAKGKIANIYGIYYDEKERIMFKVYDKCDYPLDDIINRIEVGMTEIQTKHIIRNVCEDIKKLHGQGFIHCDLKPSNVLYCKKGTHKRRHRDKQSFKVIDYDGVIWNANDDVVNTEWQGSLPFSAPEMSDYAGDGNNIGYALDVWSVGLLIIFCINGGDLGRLDIDDDDHKRFYQEYEEEDEIEIKAELFDSWYSDLFGPGMPYKKEIIRMFKTGKISAKLYDLLYNGILVKNPEERMTIKEVLNHEWFYEDDEDDEYDEHDGYDGYIKIGKNRMDLYDAIMSKDIKIRNHVIMQQIHKLGKYSYFRDDEKSDDDTEDTESDKEDDEYSEDEQNQNIQNEPVDDERSPEIKFFSDEDDEDETQEPNGSEFYGNSSYESTDNETKSIYGGRNRHRALSI